MNSMKAHNLLVSVRPLTKMHCKHLKELNLEGNYINDLGCMALTNFSVNFCTLSIEK
jgi:hypothetical protein